jgi:hypothetical protein
MVEVKSEVIWFEDDLKVDYEGLCKCGHYVEMLVNGKFVCLNCGKTKKELLKKVQEKK